jgi:hypothetical protein
LLSDPGAPIPPRIIKSEPKSLPPVYSPELTALLTSVDSRVKKALQKSYLITPPTLPVRADPSSEQARLLGPFSKRREVNIRWRYFSAEWRKVLPPLQLNLMEVMPTHNQVSATNDAAALSRAGVRGIGMQGADVFQHVENLAGPSFIAKAPTRREKRIMLDNPSNPSPSLPPTETLPSRWIRRRYRQLWGRLPILTYFPANQGNGGSGKYEVSLSQSAITPSRNRESLVEADAADMTWLKQDGSVKANSSRGS